MNGMGGPARVPGAALVVVGLLAPAMAAAQGAGAPDRATPGALVTVRPDPEGEPTELLVEFFLVDVESIDDLRQEFTADLYVVSRWRDARLAWPTGSGDDAPRVLPLFEVWNPQIGLLNRRGVERTLPDTVRVDARGNVQYSQRVRGQFASPLDLRRFPFDRQQLEVQLFSYRYGPDELVVEVGRTVRRERLSVAGWRIGQPAGEASLMEVESVGNRAGVLLRVEAERDENFYLLTMAVPLLLIAMMAWSVFWIDPSFLPSQVALSTASVFTLIAFRLSLMWSLPKISYMTIADRFVLAVTLLVFAALGETVLAGRLFKTGREELARAVDRWARGVYAAILLIICVAMFAARL